MRFQSYDALRIFMYVAHHGNISMAADALHLTKGAISYQIKTLEQALGFDVFHRRPRGVELTPKGQSLLETLFGSFGAIDAKINALRPDAGDSLTIGLSSYFAARWLSPRLMEFMQLHPGIRLRIQPMINLIDLTDDDMDIMIRWGRGDWTDMKVVPFLPCPAWPAGNAAAARTVRELGLKRALEQFTLLRDRDDSDAWSHWFDAAGLKFLGQTDTLIIPDPNVRVQAVIDGQGIALNDTLVSAELDAGSLCRLSSSALEDYGYFVAYPHDHTLPKAAEAFVDWLLTMA